MPGELRVIGIGLRESSATEDMSYSDLWKTDDLLGNAINAIGKYMILYTKQSI